LPGSLAQQPCPAALPSSLARQPCPAALPGSLARQPGPAALPDSLAEILLSLGQQNCNLYYGRRPACSIAYFYRPKAGSLVPSLPRNPQDIAILSLVYKLI
jgi:hypothetical protein